MRVAMAPILLGLLTPETWPQADPHVLVRHRGVWPDELIFRLALTGARARSVPVVFLDVEQCVKADDVRPQAQPSASSRCQRSSADVLTIRYRQSLWGSRTLVFVLSPAGADRVRSIGTGQANGDLRCGPAIRLTGRSSSRSRRLKLGPRFCHCLAILRTILFG